MLEKEQEKTLSERKNFKKEEDPMWAEKLQVIKEDFPDPVLPRNLDERLEFSTPGTSKCQNGMTYDVNVKGAKKMPRNRPKASGRQRQNADLFG